MPTVLRYNVFVAGRDKLLALEILPLSIYWDLLDLSDVVLTFVFFLLYYRDKNIVIQ